MSIEELVMQWHESVNSGVTCETPRKGQCCNNCADCFFQLDCPEIVKFTHNKWKVLKSKIKQLAGDDTRIFIVSERVGELPTECIVSSWDHDGCNHHLEICPLEVCLKANVYRIGD